jgi:hypothetical protein
MDTLTIRHRGEQREFRLTKGGYDFDGQRISISIETWAEDQQSPYAANLSLSDYPLRDETLKPDMQLTFKDDHTTGWDEENTHANAYFDFHAESVELTFKVLAVDLDSITVQLSAITKDYGYEDDGRKLNPMTGTFRLSKKPKSELWIPS